MSDLGLSLPAMSADQRLQQRLADMERRLRALEGKVELVDLPDPAYLTDLSMDPFNITLTYAGSAGGPSGATFTWHGGQVWVLTGGWGSASSIGTYSLNVDCIAGPPPGTAQGTMPPAQSSTSFYVPAANAKVSIPLMVAYFDPSAVAGANPGDLCSILMDPIFGLSGVASGVIFQWPDPVRTIPPGETVTPL